MIRVHYKPLEALRPVHLALLASLDQPKSAKQVASNLSIPQMIIDHAIEDVTAWGLAESNGAEISLTERGNRCVAVWTATAKQGFWEFQDGTGWLLGKGVFLFRKPLKSLADAGLDPETGTVLSEQDAKARLKNIRNANLQLEKEIDRKVLRHAIIQAFEKEQHPTAIVEAALSKARTRLHLNQLCRLARSTISEIQQTNAKHLPHQQKEAIQESKNKVEQLEGELQWQIRDHEAEIQDATRVLLAAWLVNRDGFLKEIAAAEPDALIVRSDCGDFTWMEERPLLEETPVQCWMF